MSTYTKNILLVLTLLSVSFIRGAAQETRLPYYCGFETPADTAGWRFAGVSLATGWCIGGAEYRSGGNGLYVSADGGATAGYAESAGGYYIVAYRKFTVQPMQEYDLVFDSKAGGERARDGSMEDGMTAAWIPASRGVPAAGMGGGQFPAYARQYAVTSDDGRREYANCGWSNVAATVSALEAEYYLAFVWKADGADVKGAGACVDNVQLGLKRRGGCAEKPWNLKSELNEDKSGANITWEGRADEYELQYYETEVKGIQSVHHEKGVTTKNYTIELSNSGEGIFSVLIRSICGGDTSVWRELSNVFIYDASAHCLDYINLGSSDVLCTSGTFLNPYSDIGVIDYGYNSVMSNHTIHYVQDEYDPRTNYMLKTVPEGAVASVRISNWQENPAGSASISYNYHVTDESDVLKVRYAAVLQYASHHPAEDQTRIIVEIFDAKTDTLLSECTRSEFNAKDVDVDKVRGWHEFPIEEQPVGLLKNAEPIKWCDWSVIGINLQEYVGMDLRIRYTLKACGANFHFAYAYFTLDCDDGDVDGITCGEHPEVFRVPEGFLYRWYRMSDPGTTVGTEDTLAIEPNDTATYGVDLIFPENEGCYFTLKASALPRRPVAGMDYTIEHRGCGSVVRMKNLSRVYGFWEGDTIETGDTCKVHVWNFGDYGVSGDFEPEITVPAEGDTFRVSLAAAIDNGMTCMDAGEFTVEVPSIVIDTTFVEYGLCDGAEVVHDGRRYTEPGREVLHYGGASGCDSVVVLDIRVMVADTVSDTDSVCPGELPVLFHGQELTETGRYEAVDTSALGCDSVIHILDLTVLGSVVADVAGRTEVCADEAGYAVAYDLYEGVLTDYVLRFDTAARAEGFADVRRTAAGGDDGRLVFTLPEGVTPGRYGAELTFYNGECGESAFPVAIDVLYPRDVVAQRWNDVLGVRRAEYNGGYEFSAFQWYRDGDRLDGEDESLLYEPAGLDTAAEYRVLLTRAGDGVAQFTCGVTPVRYGTSELEVFPTVVFGGGTVSVSGKAVSRVSVYGADGRLVAVHRAFGDGGSIPAPDADGVYVLVIVCGDGEVFSEKIVVKR